jgi:hypothetical protein
MVVVDKERPECKSYRPEGTGDVPGIQAAIVAQSVATSDGK